MTEVVMDKLVLLLVLLALLALCGFIEFVLIWRILLVQILKFGQKEAICTSSLVRITSNLGYGGGRL
jgi:hypothetical protein